MSIIMASLLTRDELDKLIAELVKTRALMSETAMICEKCHSLYRTESEASTRRRGYCYCDY